MRLSWIPVSILLFPPAIGLCAERLVEVDSDASLRAALAAAQPGTRIRIAPGNYRPGVSVQRMQGADGLPIVVEGDASSPPVFASGAVGWQLSDCAYVTLRNLTVRGQSGNGLNIDDGGDYQTPAHHIVLENIHVAEIGPTGNRDGIKLSGVDDFTVRNCSVEGWGGQAIDMVGCHRGLVEGCRFVGKPGFSASSGPQTKGGSAEILIRNCRFDRAGERGVNLGGSTGKAYFRPPGAMYEARDITVEGCQFTGGMAPVAFVGVERATVRFNTIYRPEKWVLRILQETRDPGFAVCGNNRFENNLIVFRRSEVQIPVNIGPDTAPETFHFAGNYWFCEDRPEASRPPLPSAETGGVYGADPLLDAASGALLPKNPVAAAYGVSGWKADPGAAKR